MDRRYFMAANTVPLRHDRRRSNKSARGVLGSMGVAS